MITSDLNTHKHTHTEDVKAEKQTLCCRKIACVLSALLLIVKVGGKRKPSPVLRMVVVTPDLGCAFSQPQTLLPLAGGL